jgi:hypothetical protein
VFEESIRFYNRKATEADGVPPYAAEEGAIVPRAAAKKDSASLVASLWCAQLQRDLYSLGLAERWNTIADGRAFAPEPARWRERIKLSVAVRDQARWWRRVEETVAQRQLVTFAFLKTAAKLQRASYLEVPHGGWNDRVRIGRIALTTLRCGSSTLRIHTGAWYGEEEAQRTCLRCGSGAVDDERHFLLHCAAFSDSRTTLLQRINTLVQQSEPPWLPHRHWRIQEESEDDQFRILCGNAHALLRPPKTQQQYLRVLLIEVGQWMQQHRAHQQFLRNILQPK